MTTHESNAATSRRAVRRGDELDARVVPMLQELAPHLEVEPDPEYRRAARQRLVAMAAVRTPEPVRRTPLRRLLAARAVDAPARRWRTRATAGLAGAALTVTALATLVALSTGARPGDVLYGLKRGTEQTQLALAGDSRGQALLDLARTRLDEVSAIDGDATLVRSTLSTMDDQTTEGASWYFSRVLGTSDAAPLDRLSAWTTDQSAQLDSVEVPPEAADDVSASQTLLTEVAERIAGVRAALDCPTEPISSSTDRLGPVPDCPPAIAAPPSQGGAVEPGDPSPAAPAPAPEAVPNAATPQRTTTAGPTGGQPVPEVAPTIPPLPLEPPDVPATPPSSPLGELIPPIELLPPTPTATTSRPPLNLEDGKIEICLPRLLDVGKC